MVHLVSGNESKIYDYFSKNYSILNTSDISIKININNPKIFYLEKINAENLFYILKESKMKKNYLE